MKHLAKRDKATPAGNRDRLLAAAFWVTAFLTFLRPSWLKLSTPWGTLSITSANTVATVFCALWIAAAVLNRRRYVIRNGLELPFILFAAANVAAAVFSPYGSAAERGASVLELLRYIIFFYACLYLLRDDARRRAVPAVLFPVAVFVAGADLFYHWERGMRFIIDQGYPFWDGKNALGLFMVLSMALCAPGLSFRRPLRRAAAAAGLAMLFLCAVYSYSRAAWLALGGAAVAFAFCRSLKIVLLLGVALLILLPLPRQRIVRRIVRTGGAFDNNAALRFDVWRTAWGVLREYPLHGVGPGQFRTVARMRAGAPRGRLTRAEKSKFRHLDHAHNLFLQAGAEAGWFGIGALLWGCVAAAAAVRRSLRSAPSPERRRLATGIAAALAAFLVFSMVDCSWTGRFTGGSFLHINLIVMMILAMLYSLDAQA